MTDLYATTEQIDAALAAWDRLCGEGARYSRAVLTVYGSLVQTHGVDTARMIAAGVAHRLRWDESTASAKLWKEFTPKAVAS